MSIESLSVDTYDNSRLFEDKLRRELYSSPMNFEPRYGLVRLTEEIWEAIRNHGVRREPDPNLLVFAEATPFSLADARAHLAIFAGLAPVPSKSERKEGVLVAGGAVFGALFGLESDDVDIFLWGGQATQSEGRRRLQEMADRIQNLHVEGISAITRSVHAVTFHSRTKYQVILRLYRSPSEVLHGFDVDCCGLGYDPATGEIWMTRRALYSLLRRENTFAFDRMSPSYEYRLAKYGSRGMAVRLPPAPEDMPPIDENSVRLFWAFREFGQPDNVRRAARSELQGRDRLYYLAWFFRTRGHLVAKPVSDYENLGSIQFVCDACRDDPQNERFRALVELLEPFVPALAAEGEEENEGLVEAFIHSVGVNYGCGAVGVNLLSINTAYLDVRALLGLLMDVPSWLHAAIQLNNDFNDTSRLDPREPAPLVWNFPSELTFMTVNPGAQFTGSFHATVLKDPRVWFRTRFATGAPPFLPPTDEFLEKLIAFRPIWERFVLGLEGYSDNHKRDLLDPRTIWNEEISTIEFWKEVWLAALRHSDLPVCLLAALRQADLRMNEMYNFIGYRIWRDYPAAFRGRTVAPRPFGRTGYKEYRGRFYELCLKSYLLAGEVPPPPSDQPSSNHPLVILSIELQRTLTRAGGAVRR